MNEQTPSAAPAERGRTASTTLLAAALSGLMGVAVVAACSDDPTNADPGDRPDGGTPQADGCATPTPSSDAGSDAPSDAGDAGTYNNPVLVDAGFSLADMEAACQTRGGFVYVNAACAGGAMCKGLSFHKDTLWDHSCRGQNSTCSGVGCVDMPADKGLTGKQVYEDGPCGSCHADWSSGTPDFTKYAVFYFPQDKTEPQALADFNALTNKQLEAKVAWGANGIHKDGTPYHNMDAYFRKYSRAEVTRVAAHLKTLQAFAYTMDIFGVDAGDGGP